MFSLRHLLDCPVGLYTYMWVEVFLIKETPKAILIEFDGRKTWLPKAWIGRIKRKGMVIFIKISLYHWAKKFS